MTTQRVVFIIPGFRQLSTNKAYKQIAKILRSEGCLPILINIPWKQNTILENTEYFLKKYKRSLMLRNKKIKKKYILGFSFGAMIAFLASTKVSASGLILCSLSPYFKEDLLKSNNTWQYQDFSRLHCAILAKQIKAKQIHMLYGVKETKSLIKRVTDAFDQISCTNKYLIPIKETDHDIGDRRYLNTIHQIAKELN